MINGGVRNSTRRETTKMQGILDKMLIKLECMLADDWNVGINAAAAGGRRHSGHDQPPRTTTSPLHTPYEQHASGDAFPRRI